MTPLSLPSPDNHQGLAMLPLTAALLLLTACTSPLPTETVTPVPAVTGGHGKPQPKPRRSHRTSRSERRPALHAAHDWSRVGACESAGDPTTNTGNGYYGYLQESEEFWRSFGGLRFAARPDLATRDEQITVAERGLAAQGVGAWPVCGVYLRSAA